MKINREKRKSQKMGEIIMKSIVLLNEIEQMSKSSMNEIWGGRMDRFTGCNSQDHVTSATNVATLEVW